MSMKIELVKEYDRLGQISYYVAIDGMYERGTARYDFTEAQEIYEQVKKNYTQARKVVLMCEEI